MHSMENNGISFNRKRDPGTIVRISFRFLTDEFKPLSRLILIYFVPLLLIYAFGSVLFQMKFTAPLDFSDNEKLIKEMTPYYLNFLLFTLFGIFIQSLYAGAFYTYVEEYILKGKGNFTINDLSHRLFPNTLLALGTGIAGFILVMFGLMLCIVPGIYYANSISLALFIVIKEKKGIGQAIFRSFQLVRIKWWDTFFLNLTALLLILLISTLFSLPSIITGYSSGLFVPQKNGPVDLPDWYLILLGVNTVITNLFYVIIYTFYVFHYYNLMEYLKPPEILPEKSSGE